MKILGLQKLTLLDFPGRIAAIVFTGGCNFRCPFCQNSSLVLSPQEIPCVSEEEFLQFLRRRRGMLDGICVTGGEPTLHADLPEFLSMIKAAGYLVKLDTNGTNPAMLQRLLDESLLDYVAMDVKAGPANYARVCGLTPMAAPLDAAGCAAAIQDSVETYKTCSSGAEQPSLGEGSAEYGSYGPGGSGTVRKLLENVRLSVTVLKDSGIEHEFRTTAVKGLHDRQDFEEIASWLPGCSRYYLQSFRDCPEVLQKNHPFSAFSGEEMQDFLAIVQKKIPQAALRGL